MVTKASGQKVAGLLDAPQDTLPWDVWSDINGTYKLRPPISNYILSKLYDVVPKVLVAKVYILGSITGYKYKETSDIDVNVYLRANVSKEEVKLYHVKMRAYNETLAPGTKHPVNFYISYYVSDTAFSYSAYGVYSVTDDKWIKEPSSRDSIKDPAVEFAKEVASARIFARHFARLSDEYNKDLLDYKSLTQDSNVDRALRSKQLELEADINRLVEAEQQLHAGRELAYRAGWGIPRRSFRNILYKLIEHGQYGRVLKGLKSYRHSE